MVEPTSRPEWRLVHCPECRVASNHRRVRDRLFRCERCSASQELTEADPDRTGLLQPRMPAPPYPAR